MTRRYRPIWLELKRHHKASVDCHPDKVATIIQAVKKEKSGENAPRKALELKAWDDLEITVADVKVAAGAKPLQRIKFVILPTFQADDL